MAFMQPEVVGKEDWAGVETSAGFWWVPFTVLTKAEAASARSGDFEPLLKYTEGGKIYNDQSSIKAGYGVRLSAPGYLDSSEWEVYGSKKEALRRARELGREAEGEDYATKKRAHATKKSPASKEKRLHFAGYDFTAGPEGTVVHRPSPTLPGFQPDDRVEYRDVNLWQQGTVTGADGKWVMVRWDGNAFVSREWAPNLRHVSTSASGASPRSARSHATKKSPTQLDREIKEVLAAPRSGSAAKDLLATRAQRNKRK
jgi:hypothetical protein